MYADVMILITHQYPLSNQEQQTDKQNSIKELLKVDRFVILAYDVVSLDNRVQTFRDNLVVSYLRVRKF